MNNRFFAGLQFGLAFICIIAGVGEFATDEPLSAYGKGGWLNGLLIGLFSERGVRIALSTIYFAIAAAWHFAWLDWKRAKPNEHISKTSKHGDK